MKEHINAITAMRGMGVLGVIGIHVGGIYLENPSANLILLSLYDEISRYAVPIFFFLSAFGLFYKLDLNEKFNFVSMLRRRLKAVLIPYIVWSFFYLWHTSYCYNMNFPTDKIGEILFFGLAKYHIYFLVLLIWFYIFMPLWIYIAKNLQKKRLLLLFIIQITINYVLCYNSEIYLLQQSLEKDSLPQLALTHRLNYWVIYYAFIFLLGAYLAQRFDKFKAFLKTNKNILIAFFLTMAFAQSAHFIILVKTGSTPLQAIYTAHQLSPIGIVYTISACLFFFWLFTYPLASGKIYDFVTLLGKHSYFIYLIHPLFLTIAVLRIASSGAVLTAGFSILLYFAALFSSLLSALIFKKIASKIPLLNFLVLGK